MRVVSVVTELVDSIDHWREAHPRAPRGSVPAALAAALLAFVLFASLAPAAMPSGDAALYAQQARHLDFGERSVHIGYFAVAAASTFFRSSAPDLVFNLLSALFGAATVALLALATARLAGRIDLGVLAGLALCGGSTFLRQAVWAEVYIGQAFFFVLALWLFFLARPARAGVALAGSVLFSPSTLLGVPGLVLSRPRPKAVAVLGLCGGGLVLAVLAFVWQDYFFGPRGLFGAPATTSGVLAAAVKEAFELLYGLTALLPFVLLGAWALLRHRLGRLALGVLAAIWAPTFLLGERYPDVPVQLPTWILLAPVAAAGLAALEARLAGAAAATRTLWLAAATTLALVPYLAIPVVATRSRAFARLDPEWVAGLITFSVAVGALAFWLSKERPRRAAQIAFAGWLLSGAVLGSLLVIDQNREFLAYRDQVLALESEAAVDYVALGSWEQNILLEHYIYGRPYTGHTLDLAALGRSVEEGGDGEGGNEEADRLFERALRDGREIWLLAPNAAIEGRLESAGFRLEDAAGFRVARPGVEASIEEPIEDQQ